MKSWLIIFAVFLAANPNISYSKNLHSRYTSDVLFQLAKKLDTTITKELWNKLSPVAQESLVVHGHDEYIIQLKTIKWDKPTIASKQSIREVKQWRILQRSKAASAINKKLNALHNHLSNANVTILKRYQYLPVIKVKINKTQDMTPLLSSDDVVNVSIEEYYKINLIQSLPIINQPTAANGNIQGNGVSVAIFDTGLDYTNATFNCVEPVEVIPTENDTCKVVATYETAPADNSLDDDGHGTTVSEVTHGVAPNAGIISFDVFEVNATTGERLASSTDINTAVDILVGIRDQFNVVAANFSLGTSTLYSDECSTIFVSPPPRNIANPLSSAMDTLTANEILPIAASGNDASSTSISSPGCINNALAIGATYDQAFADVNYANCSDSNPVVDQITCFSNSDNTVNLLAPGSIINGTAGTSFAAPHVTGASALIASRFLGIDTSGIRQKLLTSDTILTDSRNQLSFPRLSLSDALVPNNDDITSAEEISVSSVVSSNSLFSSAESGETVNTSVWYVITPQESGNYSISLNSTQAMLASIFSGDGDISSLSLLGSSSDNSVFLESGETYYIQVSSNQAGGEFELEVSLNNVPIPVNIPLPLWSIIATFLIFINVSRYYSRNRL